MYYIPQSGIDHGIFTGFSGNELENRANQRFCVQFAICILKDQSEKDHCFDEE